MAETIVWASSIFEKCYCLNVNLISLMTYINTERNLQTVF